MKLFITGIAFILSGFLTPFTEAGSYSLDLKKSKLEWSGSAAVGNYVLSGTLDFKEGQLETNESGISSGRVVVDMKSLKSQYPDLSKHLKGKDFFYVKKFPEASFALTGSQAREKGFQLLEGQLSIRDSSKLKTALIEMRSEKGQIILSGKLVLDRTEFGVNHNSPTVFPDLVDNVISDEITANYTLVFSKNE